MDLAPLEVKLLIEMELPSYMFHQTLIIIIIKNE